MMRLSGFWKMYAYSCSKQRGTTMWLPLMSRSVRVESGSPLAARAGPCRNDAAQGPAAFTKARAVSVRSFPPDVRNVAVQPFSVRLAIVHRVRVWI